MSKKQWLGIALAFGLLGFCCSPVFRVWATFPGELRIVAGTSYQLQLPLPFQLSISADQTGLSINDKALTPNQAVMQRGRCALFSSEPTEVKLRFRLFGVLPLGGLRVNVVEPIQVAPSGHSIGVTIRATTMVVGHGSIKTNEGMMQPSKEVGLRLGDLLLAANKRENPSVAQVAQEIERSGRNDQPITLTVKRGEQQLKFNVRPVYCQDSHSWRIGLYIRDDAAGVGTLTFVDQESKTFGALGHIIADAETNHALEVQEGKIVRSRVTSIEQGRTGFPGEKRSIIVDEDNVLGIFTANTGIGIFGDIIEDITVGSELMPVALVDEIVPGKAEILTVIENEKVERFEVSIVRVIKQFSPSGKGLVIKVTDPDLLAKTGGIVQGMSGSPILQNGRLVGAITHVFVNKPDSGYGVFAEWMVRESGLLEKRQELVPTFFYRRYLRQTAGRGPAFLFVWLKYQSIGRRVELQCRIENSQQF